jgi:hypothetical protein
MPRWMAAFSAGMPNESHPIGCEHRLAPHAAEAGTASPIE